MMTTPNAVRLAARPSTFTLLAFVAGALLLISAAALADAASGFGSAVNRLEEKKKKRCLEVVMAAREGDISVLGTPEKPLSKKQKKRLDINCHDTHGYTPLHHAARKSQLRFMRRLFEMGVDVNAVTTENGWTPLMEASYWGHTQATRELLAAGADVNALSLQNQDVLIVTGRGRYFDLKEQPKIIKILLKHGANASVIDNNNQNALFHAAENECLGCLRPLLEAGSDPYLVNTDGKLAIQVVDDLGFEAVKDVLKSAMNPQTVASALGLTTPDEQEAETRRQPEALDQEDEDGFGEGESDL